MPDKPEDVLTDEADEALVYHCPRCNEELEVDEEEVWGFCHNRLCHWYGMI